VTRGAFPSPGGLFSPLSPLLAQIPFAPELTALDFLNSTRDLRAHSGRRIAFVPPPAADGLAYETRIWQRGEVATRPGNWHDFFNALVWLTFPLTKATLNARHAAAIARQPGSRGRERDAMTHFDECGAVVVSSDPDLLALLRAFQWSTLFWERRPDLPRALRCFVFGHATYDQLRQPFRGLTAKAVLHQVAADWLARPLAEQLVALDRRLAAEFAAGEHLQPRGFHPLPLLGLPGVTADNEAATYYDDGEQFRPGRRRPGV
jgi:hypothetical protein